MIHPDLSVQRGFATSLTELTSEFKNAIHQVEIAITEEEQADSMVKMREVMAEMKTLSSNFMTLHNIESE